MNLLNPLSKDHNKIDRVLAVLLNAIIAGLFVGAAFIAEQIIWEHQTETIYKKTDLVECVHYDLYYSTWRTVNDDTVAVYNENNVHIHNMWCCRPISCEGTRILTDSIPAIPTKLEKVRNNKSCTYHWERKKMWNW